MKKFKKNEFAIYAIALMLVTAGYFNYSTFDKKTQETYSEDIQELDEKKANVGDAVLVSNNEVENNEDNSANKIEKDNNETKNIEKEENNKKIKDTEKEQTEKNNNEIKEIAKEDNKEGNKGDIEEDNKEKNDDETKNKNNKEEEKANTNDYFAESKLDRDKMYAEMVSNYQKIIDNKNSSEAQKSIATQEITRISNIKNAIMICENLILTKGFENCVIFENKSSINVVVSKAGGLKTEDVAKLQNIISREIETTIDKIHIAEK